MTTAREDTTRLADLLRREHHALAEFLIALSRFDAERRWMELGYRSLFDFLRRELRLSAGAAQYRKTAAELVGKYPEVEAALRKGDLCLSSVIELAKVLSLENASDVLPRFLVLSSRDAAFVAASIRPIADPPRRDFVVTAVRPAASPVSTASTPEATSGSLLFRAPEPLTEINAPQSPVAAAVSRPALDRPAVKPLDTERARVSMTVSRRLLDKLARARDALSHSHPGATEEQILEVGLDLILARAAKRRGLVEKPRKSAPAERAAGPDAPRPAKRSRYIPAEVRRAVWQRDEGKCQWPWTAAGSAGPRTRPRSTTSTDSRSGARPAPRGAAFYAGVTRTSPLGSSTGTSS